ncbi:hypothetical protein B0H11DRAFT_2250052 [Mycena galericulata]|nr:hypothetical protein B0H11DRAFT_2250052 [Mycena galericulata]
MSAAAAGSDVTVTPAVTRTHTNTSLATTALVSDASQPDLGDADLGGFFGATPGPESVLPAQPPRVNDTPTSAPPPSAGSVTPVSKGKERARNASPGPFVPPLDAAAEQFLGNLNLPEATPQDTNKRFDGRSACQGITAGLHSLASSTARLCGDLRGFQADSVSSVTGVLSPTFLPEVPFNTGEGLHSQVLELDSALVAARAELNDRQHDAETRVRAVENTGLQNSAQLGAIFDTLQTLMAQVSALQAQAATAAALVSIPVPVAPQPAVIAPPVPAPPALEPLSHAPPPYSGDSSAAPAVPPAPVPAPSIAPAPLPPVALGAPSSSSTEQRVEQLEALLRETREAMEANKRTHAPSPSDIHRAVRARVDVAASTPAPVTIAATGTVASAAPPAFTVPLVDMPPAVSGTGAPPTFVAPPYAMHVPTSTAYTPAIAAPSYVAPPVQPAPALTPTVVQIATPPPPIAPAPVLGPTPVSVVTNPVNVPPALPPIDPHKEARLGPVKWGRNITGESSTVIKTVLPAARGIMRNYRARRVQGDPYTIIACFETAEIASWFVPAFNSSRVPPYDTVLASPNV